MSAFLLVAMLVQWLALLAIGLLLVGTLRALGVVRWQLLQLQSTTPSRVGRDGLKPGTRAPDFTLPTVADGECSLSDVLGRPLLLVFTQNGCGPCHAIVPELNRIHDRGEHRVVIVNNGEPDATRRWAAGAGIRFPVFIQEKFAVSKRYEAFATPFVFLIDEGGTVLAKGIASSPEHLGYVLREVGQRAKHRDGPAGPDGTGKARIVESTSTREVTHA